MLFLLIFITGQKLLLLCMKQPHNISLKKQGKEALLSGRQSLQSNFLFVTAPVMPAELVGRKYF